MRIRRFQRWLRDNFLTGLAIVLPVALSIFLCIWALERITGGVFNKILKKWPSLREAWPEGEIPQETEILVRVIILLGMIGIVILIGWLARNIIGKHLIKLGDMILERIPLFNRIYAVFKQISHSVLSEKSEMFSAAVLIEFPRSGIRSIAFITSRTTGEIQDKTQGTVYTLFVPTSPNPTSGFMIVATEDEFQRLEMSVEEAMKMVISGGAVLPEGGMALSKTRQTKKKARASQTQAADGEQGPA